MLVKHMFIDDIIIKCFDLEKHEKRVLRENELKLNFLSTLQMHN